MAPPGATQVLLSPAELSYLHSSLAATPPIRPDLRSPTQFRPLVAETGILPGTNGSARMCFSDGTEALVGVKAELEKTPRRWTPGSGIDDNDDDEGDDDDVQMKDGLSAAPTAESARVDPSWLDVSLELPGLRDDDALVVSLTAMLTESLLASGSALAPRLRLNARWHWKLCIDLLLLSAPLAFPLPLLSMATHLALKDAKLPRRTSAREDDPLFDDDWAAGRPLYDAGAPPPVTLLVAVAGDNAVFDPAGEEIAVAEALVAVALARPSEGEESSGLRVLALRTVDPPSRTTAPGVPNAATEGATEGENAPAPNREEMSAREAASVWTPPRGGLRRAMISRIIKQATEPGGVGDDVLAGLAGVDA